MTLKYTELIAARADYIAAVARMQLAELIDEWMRLQNVMLPDTDPEAQTDASRQLDMMIAIGRYVHGKAFSDALWHYKKMLSRIAAGDEAEKKFEKHEKSS